MLKIHPRLNAVVFLAAAAVVVVAEFDCARAKRRALALWVEGLPDS